MESAWNLEASGGTRWLVVNRRHLIINPEQVAIPDCFGVKKLTTEARYSML